MRATSEISESRTPRRASSLPKKRAFADSLSRRIRPQMSSSQPKLTLASQRFAVAVLLGARKTEVRPREKPPPMSIWGKNSERAIPAFARNSSTRQAAIRTS